MSLDCEVCGANANESCDGEAHSIDYQERLKERIGELEAWAREAVDMLKVWHNCQEPVDGCDHKDLLKRAAALGLK